MPHRVSGAEFARLTSLYRYGVLGGARDPAIDEAVRRLALRLDGRDEVLEVGDGANIPAGTVYRLGFAGRNNRLLCFSGADAMGRLFAVAGRPTGQDIYPSGPAAIDPGPLRAALAGHGTRLA